MYSYFASSDAHRGIQNIYLDIYSNILPTILSPFILAYSGNLFDILSGMFVSGISSDFFLAFYLIYLQIFFVVNMPCLMIVTFFLAFYLQRLLCGRGPAKIAFIQRLLFGSGGEHCDLGGLQLRSGGGEGGQLTLNLTTLT